MAHIKEHWKSWPSLQAAIGRNETRGPIEHRFSLRLKESEMTTMGFRLGTERLLRLANHVFSGCLGIGALANVVYQG
jgi:hypothetical protein